MITAKKTTRDFAITGAYPLLKDLIRLRYVSRNLSLFKSNRIINSRAGENVSKLRGKGIVFDEVRMYQQGDDIRRMDWRLTAKTGSPHIKLYHDERERPVYLLVDDRHNMFFGTKVAFKSVIAAQIAALVGWAALEHGERVGAIICTGEKTKEFKPKRRNQSLLQLFKELTKENRSHSSSYLSESLAHLRRVAKPGSIVFIVSDFYNVGDDFEKHISQLKKHNEVKCFMVYDPIERKAPTAGVYQISDGDDFYEMDTSNRVFLDQYKKFFNDNYRKVIKTFARWNISWEEFATDESVMRKLSKITGNFNPKETWTINN